MKAQQLVDENFFSGVHGMPYQTIGNLRITHQDSSQVSEYYRELDLETGIVRTEFQKSGVKISSEAFASFPDQVLVFRLKADEAKPPDNKNHGQACKSAHECSKCHME